MAIFDFIEGWYNPHRQHSSIGYLSPGPLNERFQRSSRDGRGGAGGDGNGPSVRTPHIGSAGIGGRQLGLRVGVPLLAASASAGGLLSVWYSTASV